MSTDQLVECYILNGRLLHRDVNITMVYLKQMGSSVTRDEVLAIWESLDGDEISF